MATARKSVSHLYLHAGVLRVGCLVGEASAGDYGRGIYATGGARDCSARSCAGVLCAEQRGELWARGDNVWQRGARLPMPSQRVIFLMRYGGRPVAGGGGGSHSVLSAGVPGLRKLLVLTSSALLAGHSKL